MSLCEAALSSVALLLRAHQPPVCRSSAASVSCSPRRAKQGRREVQQALESDMIIAVIQLYINVLLGRMHSEVVISIASTKTCVYIYIHIHFIFKCIHIQRIQRF